MEQDRMPYFEVIKLLEEALPSTVYFDYTKINGEQLWRRVLNFLDKAQINLPDDFMRKMEAEFKGLGNRLYGKKTHVLRGRETNEDMGFDQNNYHIKDYICWLKTELMEKIYDKCYYVSEDAGYERTNFGELDKVREHVSDEEIKKFVVNHFVVTKEKDMSKIHMDFTFLMAKQIFLYFGLCTDTYISEFETEVDRVYKIIRDVFSRSMVYHGKKRIEDGVELYESSSMDMDVFNLETQKAIEKIVRFISQKCNAMIQKGIERNKLLDEWERKRQEENKEEPSVPQYEEKDFDELMSMFNEMQELIEKNKRIVEQISELDKKKAELQQELEENNAKIMEGIKRGIK